MNNYIDFNARHVAALLLIEARKGIRPPVMQDIIPKLNIALPRRFSKTYFLEKYIELLLVQKKVELDYQRWWKNEEAEKTSS